MTTSCYDARPWLRFYPEGVPAEIEVPKKSLPQIFEEAVARWQNKTAIVFYGRKINYTELKELVDRFAAALYGLGIRKGDKVAIHLLNCPQYVIAYYGLLKIGAIVTTVSPMYVSPEVRHQLEDSEAKDIISQNILFSVVEKSGVKLRNVILTDIGEYLPRFKSFLGRSPLSAVYRSMALPSPKLFEREGFYQFQDLIKKGGPPVPPITINPEQDLATLQYTGGTTGFPRAAMLTHYNHVFAAAQTAAFYQNALIDGKETVAAYLPFYHAAGQVYLTLGLSRGYTLVVSSNSDLDGIISDMSSNNVTMFVGVPTVYDMLKDYEKTNRVAWKDLHFVCCGADALLEEVSNGFERRTGVRVCELYGQSEVVAMSHSNPLHRIKRGSFGVPVCSVQSAILHPDRDEYLPPNEVGEIAVISPTVMKGYWKHPEENREKFSKIGDKVWMRTGDLGRMDEEGYFYFYDRKRDMIKYKGHAVFAREVEEAIKEHPAVKEVAVVGVRDPAAGENVKAVVVLQSDARGKVSEEDIVRYCSNKLAQFKIPRIVEFRGEIPKTDVGKVSRRELREEAD